MSGVGGIGSAVGVQQILQLRQQLVERSGLLQQLQAAKVSPAADAPPQSGFGDALQSALASVQAKQANAEQLSAGFQTGEVTDVAKVMLARQEAGIAFEATLQVRNKLLSAYQDIMRMGV
jgi:flagellar hook-basal body complex protein FliE